MSYNCNLEIPIKKIPSNKLRVELYDVLLDFRPDDSGLIDCAGMVLKFPSNFNDDPTGALYDFMLKHKLTMDIEFTNEDDVVEIISYIDGILQEDDDE